MIAGATLGQWVLDSWYANEDKNNGEKASDSGKEHSPDREALNDIIKGSTNDGHKPLSEGEADTVLEWAKEIGIPDIRDDRGKKHWVRGPHIHIDGVGIKHIPAEGSCK